MLFALFKKTEVIARSIIDLWIELIVQTVVIALSPPVVALAGTASGSLWGWLSSRPHLHAYCPWSGVRAVWNAFNRLFNAFGQATGVPWLRRERRRSGRVSHMTALRIGATPAQAAGLAYGEYTPLAGAARTLAYLPGVRGTALGETAEQFAEGALTRQVARSLPGVGRMAGPLIGTALLTHRDPAADLGAPSMLIPGWEKLGSLDKAGRNGRSSPRPRPRHTPTVIEDAEGVVVPADRTSAPQRSTASDAETRFERSRQQPINAAKKSRRNRRSGAGRASAAGRIGRHRAGGSRRHPPDPDRPQNHGYTTHCRAGFCAGGHGLDRA